MPRFAQGQKISIDGVVYQLEAVMQEASKHARTTLLELRNVTKGVRKDQRFILKAVEDAKADEASRLETFPERARKLIEPGAGLRILQRHALSERQIEPATIRKGLAGAQLMPLVKGRSWRDVLSARETFSKGRCKDLARALLEVLLRLEARGMAHCRLGASHILIDEHDRIELCSLESLYAPALSEPDSLPPSVPGYAVEHEKRKKRRKRENIAERWNAAGDRFAAAVLFAEMLAWHSKDVQALADAEESEGLFPSYALGRESDRHELIVNAADQALPGFAKLFARAWESRTLDEAPRLAEYAPLFGLATPALDASSEGRADPSNIKSAPVRKGVKTKTCCVFNFKGGVGKTTLTLGIAEVLAAKHGKQVLIVDLDPQANSTCLMLSDERREAAWAQGYHVASFLRAGLVGEEPPRASDAIQRDASPVEECKGVDLLASSPDLLDMELTAILRSGSDQLLSRLLQSRKSGKSIDPTTILQHAFAGLIKSNRYDLILFDCPPSFGLFTENALNASQFVLIPVTPEPISTQSMPLLVRRLANFDVRIAGALINRVDNSRPFHARRVADLRGRAAKDPGFPEYVFKNVMRNFARIEQMGEETGATTMNQRYEYRCIDDLSNIAQELLDRIGLGEADAPKLPGKKKAAKKK